MTSRIDRRVQSEGALATIAYVRGWRQTEDGRWFKPGVAGTYFSVKQGFKEEEILNQGYTIELED